MDLTPDERNAAILQYHRMLWAIVKRVSYQGIARNFGTQEDLYQEAVLSLVEALRCYDPNYGVKQMTYLMVATRRNLEVRIKNGGLVRVPGHMWSVLYRSDPDSFEPKSDAGKAWRAQNVFGIGEAEHLQARVPSTVDEVQKREDITKAHQLLASLHPRQRFIICHRFGIGVNPLTFADIGRILGLSRERIRQIELEAMTRLKEQAAGTARKRGRKHVRKTVGLRKR